MGGAAMKKYYHATDYNNLGSILANGLKPSIEGIVFMTEKPIDAVKFVALRGIPKILVVEIKTLKEHEKDIIETSDHSHSFFDCKSYGFMGGIDTSMLTDYIVYENPLFKN